MSSFRHLTILSRILWNENKLPFSNEICNPTAISDWQLHASAVINTYWQKTPTGNKKFFCFSPSHFHSHLHQYLWPIGTSFNTCTLRPRSSSCHKLSYAIDHYLLNEFFHSWLPTIKKKKKKKFFSHFFSFFLALLSFKFGSVSNAQSVHSFTWTSSCLLLI